MFGGKVVFRHDDCSSRLGASDLTRVLPQLYESIVQAS